MISKELLSEVFIKQVKAIIIDPKEDCTIGANELIICFDGYIQKWNIHELAHKCKEWARDKDIFLRSFYDYEGAFCYISAPTWVDKIEIPKTGFCSETEPEAIFKACDWILNEILQK